ncbi:MAG: DNA alkylation repair protein [candidate division Zixibacteria bacterium]|nr:DNA alkylation repair protein [candidate division Zixibacteria bacterium]
MSVDIIKKLKAEIKKQDKPSNRINYQQFHKEKLKEPTGLKAPVLRKISNEIYRGIDDKSKKNILKIGDMLLEDGTRYFLFFAFEWAGKVKKDFEKNDFPRFERWLKKYVNNWGACDHLCTGPLGHLVLLYPELSAKTKKWTTSKNLWLRRAAAVSLIVPVRNKLLLDEVFQTADNLLSDSEDLVQKGYGWMLKVAGDRYPDEVFDYVMKNKAIMPRTALRYAIEKYPLAKRKQAMVK